MSVLGYFQACGVILFIIGGLTISLKECIRVMYAIAGGYMLDILFSRILIGSAEGGRLGAEGSSISNSNDFAAHLLFMLPFALYVVSETKLKLLKVVIMLLVLYGVYLGATTGSRGALVAICTMLLYGLLRAPNSIRIGILVVVPLFSAIAIPLLPSEVLNRYMTVFNEEESLKTSEAVQSTEARKYLFWTSIDMTFQHPLFGVGPSMFAETEGYTSRNKGKVGQWQVTHNAYTQISSETGIPGFILYMCCIVGTFSKLGANYKKCISHPKLKKYALAQFFLMLSIVGFGTATIFLSLGFSMYFPAMMGIAIAWDRAIRNELWLSPQPSSQNRPGYGFA